MSMPTLTERLAERRRHREASATSAKETPSERRARLLTECDQSVSLINDALGSDPGDHVPAA